MGVFLFGALTDTFCKPKFEPWRNEFMECWQCSLAFHCVDNVYLKSIGINDICNWTVCIIYIYIVTIFKYTIYHIYILLYILLYIYIYCYQYICIYYGTPDVFICKFGNTCRGQALPDHFFLGPKVRMITGCEERFQKIKSEASIMEIEKWDSEWG